MTTAQRPPNEPESSPERLRRVRALFDAAMDLPPTSRASWLASEADDALRAEVQALVAAADGDDDALHGARFGVPTGAAPPPAAPQRLGPYHVVRLVGAGGMGAVYEAVRADDQYRKRVAIKIVQGAVASELTLARFRRERQILASLEHPHVATLLDGGVTPDGQPFLVMEFVEGEPITRWCDAHAIALRDRLLLFRQVCSAVQHAHGRLVIHRDLKPGNILVTPSPSDDGAPASVKLLDFGIAKLLGDDADDTLPLTRGGARAFTPGYASPEQIRGAPLTTASDVYALGVVLFELLAGRRPHVTDGASTRDVEQAILTQPLPKPSSIAPPAAARRLRGELDQIVLKALHPEPARRYASVDALDDDLRRWLTGMPIAARRDWAGYRMRKFVRRNAAAVAASALVLVAIVGGAGATTIQARHARTEQERSARVTSFLRELLSSVKPVTGGRDVPVSELLDAAARRADLQLDAEPDVRAQVETIVAESYRALGRFDEAARHLTHALTLRQRHDGPRSLNAATALNNLGSLELARGETDSADAYFQRALAIHPARADHPDTLAATILDNLGSVAHARNRDADGERLHRQALDMRLRLFGPRDDAVAYSMNNVAVALGDRNELAPAESLHRAAIGILRANHPGPYPLVADAENQLATILDMQGKTAAADSAYQRVLATRRQLLGADHPDYAWTAMNYSGFLFDLGRYDEAMRLAREVLALRGTKIPDSHPSIATSLQTLGRSLDRTGHVAEGGAALEESLALRQRSLPADSWLIASSESVLGEHYTLAKDYARAERLLTHADGALRRVFGADNPRTKANDRRLAALRAARAGR